MRNLKSQAALEFIMTYGWAILVVLVAIVALASFGVLSPDRFLPSKCTLQPGIGCQDYKVETPGTNAKGKILVILTNGLGYDLNNVKIDFEKCGTTAEQNIFNGAVAPFNFDCDATSTGVGASGAKYNGKMVVSYKSVASQLDHTNVGQLITRVE